MLFTNFLTIAALATSAMAGFHERPTAGGSHVATGDKEPAHHYARDATRKHYGEKGERGTAAHHYARDATHKYNDEKVDKGTAAHRSGAKVNHPRALINEGVYWCTKDNWKGQCTKSPADGTCHRWNQGPSGSFGPDKDVACTFWDGTNCQGDSTSVKYPGTGQVYFFGSKGVTYTPESWKCHTLI